MANISGIVESAHKIMRQDTGTGSDELLDMLHQSFAKGDKLLEQLRKELV